MGERGRRPPAGSISPVGRRFPPPAAGSCYRALVRARWDEAVLRGTPALTVGAQDSSLAGFSNDAGFKVVCTMYEVESDP